MKFVVYKDVQGEWRWRLVSVNGRTIADSGEGYKSRQHCLDGIDLVKKSGAAATEFQPGA